MNAVILKNELSKSFLFCGPWKCIFSRLSTRCLELAGSLVHRLHLLTRMLQMTKTAMLNAQPMKMTLSVLKCLKGMWGCKWFQN